MEIYGITGRYGTEFRVSVRANDSMNQGWLKVLNEDYNEDEKYKSFEEAMENSCYLSNNDGFLVMDVVYNLWGRTYHIEYYFDDYEKIEAELSLEEEFEVLDFIFQWEDKIPDQEIRLLFTEDDFVNALTDDIPWKKNLI